MNDNAIRSEIRRNAKDIAWGKVLLTLTARNRGEFSDVEAIEKLEQIYLDYYHKIKDLGNNRMQRKSFSGGADAASWAG